MRYDVSGNIVAELRNRVTFGGFSGERIKSFIEVMWNKVDRVLKDSLKAAGQLEECSYSKVIQSVLTGRVFKYHSWGGRFHMLPQSYKFSHDFF